MAEIKDVTWKVARRIKNVTQRTAAEFMGVSPATISAWENGETEPTISQARRLSDYYGVSLELIKT